MAIQGPTNFRADKTVAMPDEIITFTWTAATGDFDGYGIGWTGRPYAGGGFTYINKDSTSFSISMDNFPDVANEYIEYTLFAYKYDLALDNRGAESSVTVYYKKEAEEPPDPPVTAITGRLEQFQNDAGEQIYPRTIIEGIFRQSDSKPLSEILDLYAPKANPVFTGSISMGRKAGTAIGESSFAVGSDAEASGVNSHAEGIECAAIGRHAHAEGGGCIASESCDHAKGAMCTASGSYSHAEGLYTTASGKASHAAGFQTIAAAAAQTVIGKNNVAYDSMAVEYTNSDAWFIVGNGESESARSNAFRVASGGVYAYGSYNTSGADYAEMFEWADGNPDSEDRAGRFVTLDGAKIRPAGPEDDYILGIVSGNPSVVGDVHDDQWQGMYLYDIFGRPLWENAEDSNHTERRQKLNPNYDNSQKYTPRSQRPEWDAVGMLGKLVAVDDGTCQVNGWCAVGEGGIATASESRTRYRVMERLDENHVRIMIL